MYREMTPEEKLDYSSELIEAIKNNGFEGSKIVVEKYENKLKNKETKTVTYTETTPPITEISIGSNNTNSKDLNLSASIYAPEHMAAVQDDMKEPVLGTIIVQPKTRVLEQDKKNTPNPWGTAEVVLPGELKLQ